ncbi:MAG: AsmA family protein [Gammaproteobacteria bacterium]
MKWLGWLGTPIVLVVLLVALWRWDWFIPLAEAQASAALGRPVHIGHLNVGLGRIVRVTADDIVVENPPEWQGDPLARIGRLSLDVDAWAYIRHGTLVIPAIEVNRPLVSVMESASGEANYAIGAGGGTSGGGPSPQIGTLRITDGQGRVVIPRLDADFAVAMSTPDVDGQPRIRVDAQGTYARQPIIAQFLGGALLSLRDPSNPWPVDLRVENGPNRLSVIGTIQNPMQLSGASLKLMMAGPDASFLDHLAGIPLPRTPPYQLAGQLDFAGSRVRIQDFAGRVGRSDLAGTIEAELGGQRPEVWADLRSRRVDLADLGGVIGAQPGRADTPGQTAEQRAERARSAASPKLLPDARLSIPKLRWADVHLKYRGDQVRGQDMPLDKVAVDMDLIDGRIMLHPASVAIGSGSIKANVDLTPEGEDSARVKADVAVQAIDVSRLMAATQVFKGAGTISGSAMLETTGNSTAQMVARGNGQVRLAMAGGDLSAILVNLSGLQFGNALASALGLPERTQVECFIMDAALQQGVMRLRALVLDTGEGVVEGTGQADLRKEVLALQLRTEAKHFSIGSLPGPINIGGTLKEPAILPGAETVVRGGLAAGLGVLLAPLAALPTIQFGTADDERCERLLMRAKRELGGQALPPPGPKAVR